MTGKLKNSGSNNGDVESDTSLNSKTSEDEKATHNYKDKGWAWFVLVASFMTNAIVDAISFSAGIFFLEFLDYFGESKSRTSLVGSVLNGVYLATGPVASILAGKFGFRPVAMMGGVISATGLFLSTLAPNLNIVIFTFGALGGFGFGLLYLCSIAMIGQYFDKRRALATGIALSGSGIGVFAFAPLWQFLIAKYSWKGASWILSGIALNGVLFGAVYRPVQAKHKTSSHKTLERKNISETDKEVNHEIESQTLEGNYKHETTCIQIRKSRFAIDKLGPLSVLKSPSMDLYLLGCFIYTIGFYVPLTYLPDYAVGVGVSKEQAAILVSIVGVFNTLSRVATGWVADKPWANPFYIQAAEQLLGGVVTCLCSILQPYWMLGMYAAVYGACIGSNVPLCAVVVVELLGVDKLKDTFSLVILAGGMATLIGPPIAGVLYDSSKSYQPPFFFAGSTFIIAAILTLAIQRLDQCYKRIQQKKSSNLM